MVQLGPTQRSRGGALTPRGMTRKVVAPVRDKPTQRTCSIEGCNRPHFGRGWCQKHYLRWRRNGDPERLVVQFKSTPGRSIEERFWEKVDKEGPVPQHRPELGPCWLWRAGRDKSGYGQFRKESTVALAHRVSYELEHGPIDSGVLLRHRCDNPACVNPSHLRPGTQRDNMRDMRSRQRSATGRKNGSVKLTDSDVRQIRLLRQEGRTVTSLAKQFGVSRATVWRVVERKNWQHVED